MQLELKLTEPGLMLNNAVNDALQICNVLEESAQAPLLFRSVVLKRQLASIVSSILPPLGENLRQQYIKIIMAIMTPSHSQWDSFCTVIALDFMRAQILNSQRPFAEKLGELRNLIQVSETQHDYTGANQLYISACDTTREWFHTVEGTDSAAVALQQLQDTQREYLMFHQKRTRMAYFGAAACSAYASTLFLHDHDYSTVLKEVESFQEHNSKFSIPRSQERLYDLVVGATRHLGMTDKHRAFKESYLEWLQKCNFVQGTLLTNDGISESELVMRKIITDGDDTAQWGVNAIRLMLSWAGSEWEQDLVSKEDCQSLFGPGLGELPQEDLATHLSGEIDVLFLSESMFGSTEEPSNTFSFLSQYRRLRDWILVPDRSPGRQARLIAIRVFMESRLFRVRRSLALKGELPSVIQVLAIEEESQEFAQIKSFEKEGDTDALERRDKDIWKAVHATLLKSYSSEAVQAGLVKDAELVSSIGGCKELITIQRNNKNYVGQYRAILKLIELTWQRFWHFKTATPGEVVPLADEAESIFVDIRNAIAGLDPSAGLAARAHLSQEYAHREHYNFALAGSLAAFDDFTARAKSSRTEELLSLASQNYQAFLHWAFRSKGRGFTDMLKLETDVALAMKSDQVQSLPYHATDILTIPEVNKPQIAIMNVEKQIEEMTVQSAGVAKPFDGETATKKEIEEILQTLPKGVVVVDFIDVRYNREPRTFVAIIYRKGQSNHPVVSLNTHMAKIDRWVRENMYVAKDVKRHQLGGEDGLARLGELRGLLEPLILVGSEAAIKPEETVVLCPTGSLNRVPIHAIPVDGKLFIERNPVVYCQSLSILYWLWNKHRNPPKEAPVPKRTVINPMPEFYKPGKPVVSTEPVAKLARNLHANLHHGFDLQNAVARKTIEGSSILHYHGHVSFNPRSALDSAMILNQKAYESLNLKRPGCESLAAREFFKIRLGHSALATIIGCDSGVAAISSTDDVLGLPTALFYAGAGAVVSTLWPILDADGAAFATEFYGAIEEQRITARKAAVAADEMEGVGRASRGANIFTSTVNLAMAMQTAVLKIRDDPIRKEMQAPYHWAGFTLNGLWILPENIFPVL